MAARAVIAAVVKAACVLKACTHRCHRPLCKLRASRCCISRCVSGYTATADCTQLSIGVLFTVGAVPTHIAAATGLLTQSHSLVCSHPRGLSRQVGGPQSRGPLQPCLRQGECSNRVDATRSIAFRVGHRCLKALCANSQSSCAPGDQPSINTCCYVFLLQRGCPRGGGVRARPWGAHGHQHRRPGGAEEVTGPRWPGTRPA